MARKKTSAEGARPTPPVPLRRIEAVVNAASGSVGAGAGAALQAMVEAAGLEVHVAEVQPDKLAAALEAAVKAKPDLMIVLAGDGTARLAAELCGPDGPLLAPLPGGTMNMLPKAIYGVVDWREALRATLERGEVRDVSGGEVGGKAFYVAAILGAPALWAEAREAVRAMDFKLAVLRARRALARAFAGRVRFQVAGRRPRKATALTLMCPLISKAQAHEDALELDALDPRGAAEAFRLGVRAAAGGLLGDWRDERAVTTELCLEGRVWAKGRIPAIIDGEPQRFPREVEFRFLPRAFRVLAPPMAAPAQPAEKVIHDSVTSVS